MLRTAFTALLLAAPSLLPAAPLPVRWGELAPRVEQNKVALVLPDGVALEGVVGQVTREGLRVHVAQDQQP